MASKLDMEHHKDNIAMGAHGLHISMSAKVKIVQQPQSLAIAAGWSASLICRAKEEQGPSRHLRPAASQSSCVAEAAEQEVLRYQWFHNHNKVPVAIGPVLSWENTPVLAAGYYTCRVSTLPRGPADLRGCVFSEWARLEVLQIEGPLQPVPPPLGSLCVVQQPCGVRLHVGETLILECGAVGCPLPKYQWLHEGGASIGKQGRRLKIKNVQMLHHGHYRCRISNSVGVSILSDTATVDIVEDVSMTPSLPECPRDYHVTSEIPPFFHSEIQEDTSKDVEYFAVDKVALLIGNQSYHHHPQLRAPMYDVYTLGILLGQLGFKVLSAIDLTLLEMRSILNEFLELLGEGVYGLVYYAGHGYENLGQAFLVPVDAPIAQHSSDCVHLQPLLAAMQHCKTALNVLLLDMCRKRNVHDTSVPEMVKFEVTGNIVFGYATCEGADAYELQYMEMDRPSRGVFMKYLAEHIMEPLKVTTLLDLVAEGMGHCTSVHELQALEVRASLKEPRTLSDPVQPHGHTCSLRKHSERWERGQDLPEALHLHMGDGFHVRLAFTAEYSNVLVVYTTLQRRKGFNDEWSNILLEDFPKVLCDPKATSAYPSPLPRCSIPQEDTFTRLAGLQRLTAWTDFLQSWRKDNT
uniref:mucosa-associated lymphoid tissue lymphoma translocation protein 1 homolog isoform X2 n=1 Tax=Myxine glutinosa TaxID=7769 RepID=UPI00358FC573